MDFLDGLTIKGLETQRGLSGKTLTTFKSGGEAELVVYPERAEAAAELIEAFIKRGVDFVVLGGGSNVLLSDLGIKKPIISLAKLNEISVDGALIYAGAGARLSTLARRALDESLTGLEFAVAIPATLGGAVITNAGAHGLDVGGLVEYVDLIEGGKLVRKYRRELEFSYRHSSICGVVVGAMLNLDRGDKETIAERHKEYVKYRREKQPTLPSAGSVFKRDGDVSAAVYIDQLGLKGKRCGGAEVSKTHANFIVNTGGAKTADFAALADDLAVAVAENYGITLQREVQIIE